MDMIEKILQDINLHDPEDLDALIEFASLTRELIAMQQVSDISIIIRYTLEHSFYEAFSWCMGIIQEALEHKSSGLKGFECVLGKSIPDYDVFTDRLEIDFRSCSNGIETICDHNGEVEAFFNILMYKTRYPNIYFVSSENFDTKDNDYVQYKLSFINP